MTRNTAAVCECCGAREQAGQCVKGRPMCMCENDKEWFSFQALQCPYCSKCPAHCKCYQDICNCYTRLGIHLPTCPAREKSHAEIETFKKRIKEDEFVLATCVCGDEISFNTFYWQHTSGKVMRHPVKPQIGSIKSKG